MMRPWQRGLYAVTDSALTAPEDLAAQVGAAIAGGAVLVQYRDKVASPQHLEVARAILMVCRSRHVPLIINDDIALAATVGADGVHLGRDDATLTAARQQLGPDAIIGVSCYNDLARAFAAAEEGADYVAFGRFFPSPTKPHASRAEVALLQYAKQRLNIPITAIGGITANNGGALLEAGADLLAVIHGVFGQADVTAAAAAIAGLFDDGAGQRDRRIIGV